MPALVERNQVGKREDLANLISMIDAKETPFYSMAPKGKAPSNTLVEWQVDQYDDPTITGVIDGEDVSSFNNPAANRVRMRGRVQKFRQTFGVSDFSENISDVAGIGKKGEMNRAAAKALVVLKRSMEARFTSDQDSQADTGTQPYQTRGLGVWIQATQSTDLPVDTRYLTPSGSIDNTASASIQDSNLQNVFSNIYLQTGQIKDLTCICGALFKKTITRLAMYQQGVSTTVASNRLFMQAGDDKKITATVDVYQGDFGTVRLIPSPWNAFDSGKNSTTSQMRAYVLDFSNVEIAFNRLPRIMPLEDRGGGPRSFVDAITILKVYNPLSLGKFNATA
jgi:Family of unknown function (DUF5309)